VIEWFIIALVYFPNTERIEVKQMTNSFTGKQECLYYIEDTPELINDIQLIEPNNNGISFMCVTQDEIKQLKIKRKSV
jgi:hypothetical protein|tara:strand:+ start:1442 stop:1675 length:234 start_codon:yes stop_codon:yes gene_type:complete